MLSRATSLDGLLITRLCNKKDLEQGPPQFLIDEVDRLLALEKHSRKALQAYLNCAISPLPAEIIVLFQGRDMQPHDTTHATGTTQDMETDASKKDPPTTQPSQLKRLRKLGTQTKSYSTLSNDAGTEHTTKLPPSTSTSQCAAKAADEHKEVAENRGIGDINKVRNMKRRSDERERVAEEEHRKKLKNKWLMLLQNMMHNFLLPKGKECR